jgi:excalibur calcium-binding domain-containing protein
MPAPATAATEARVAGVAPLHKGEAGYRPELDCKNYDVMQGSAAVA